MDRRLKKVSTTLHKRHKRRPDALFRTPAKRFPSGMCWARDFPCCIPAMAKTTILHRALTQWRTTCNTNYLHFIILCSQLTSLRQNILERRFSTTITFFMQQRLLFLSFVFCNWWGQRNIWRNVFLKYFVWDWWAGNKELWSKPSQDHLKVTSISFERNRDSEKNSSSSPPSLLQLAWLWSISRTWICACIRVTRATTTNWLGNDAKTVATNVSTTRRGRRKEGFEKPTFDNFWEWQQANSCSLVFVLPFERKKIKWKKVQDKGLWAPCREKPLEKSGLEPAAPNRLADRKHCALSVTVDGDLDESIKRSASDRLGDLVLQVRARTSPGVFHDMALIGLCLELSFSVLYCCTQANLPTLMKKINVAGWVERNFFLGLFSKPAQGLYTTVPDTTPKVTQLETRFLLSSVRKERNRINQDLLFLPWT